MSGMELMMLGSAVGAIGQMEAASAQAEAMEYNAQLAENQAAAEAARIRGEGKRDIGRIRANIGKAGVTSEGTPLLVLSESAANVELDALNAMWSGEQAAEVKRMEARATRTAGAFGAGASLLSGVGQAM